MSDLYEFLVGGAPKQAQIPAIVEQLRRRRALGELGAVTGDRVLQPFGQNMIKQADDYATEMQDTRQKDADNAQTKAYQDAQIQYQNRTLDATLGRDRANDRYRQQMAAAAQTRAQAALEAARNKGKTALKPLPIQGIKDLNDTRQEADKISALASSFKDEYARTTAPGGRILSNTLARFGLGTKDSKEAAEWWRTFQMDFNILARNKMFGATLSANEKSSWDKAVAGEEMTAEQIKTILGTMDRWYRKNLSDKAAVYAQSYNPDQVAIAIGQEAQTQPEEPETTDDGYPIAPPEAIEELLADPSPEALQEFEEIFGPNQVPAQ